MSQYDKIAIIQMKGTERREGGEVLGEDEKKQKARAKHTISKCVQSKLLAWHTFTCTMNLEVPKKSTGSQSLRPGDLTRRTGPLIFSKPKLESRKRRFIQCGHIRNKGV